jgi:hypothetical protein
MATVNAEEAHRERLSHKAWRLRRKQEVYYNYNRRDIIPTVTSGVGIGNSNARPMYANIRM